jgi:hypothetical protein
VTKQTKHRVVAGSKWVQASVAHRSCKAYQFDFYIPKNIWKVPVVKNFFDALSHLGGATVFDEETGIWKGEKEKTQVFRLVVLEGDLPLASVRDTLREEIGRLMAILSTTKYAQETMMYTETAIRLYLAEKVTRID